LRAEARTAPAPARHRTVSLKGLVIPWRVNRRHALLACLLSFAPGETLGEAKGAPAPPLQAAEIRVGSEIEFPPFAVVDEKGQASGFSVDLLRAVAQASGLEPRFTVGPWDRVWNDLVDGNLDVLPIVAISEERRKVVDFGLPHTETFDAFFIRKGGTAIPDLRAAEGKTIGVMRSDAAQHELIERGFRGQVALVDTIPDGLRRLAAGEFDAFLCSKLVGILAMQQHGIRGLVAGPPIPDYKRVFAFGLRKGADNLKERLDQGLLIVKASGEYNRIYERWLSYEDPWRRYRRYLPAALVLLVLFAGLATFAVVAQRRRTLFLRSILDTAQDGFWLVRPDGRILSVNDAACALSGYAREDLLRMTPADLEAAERPDEVKSHLGRIFATGSDRFLTRQRRKDGTVIDVEVTAQVVPGRLNRTVVFLRDVTASRRGEEAIREKEAKLRAYFESPAVGIAITSPEKGWIEVNDRACSMLGYSREELGTRSWADLTHPEDVELDVAEFRRVIAGEKDSYSLDKRFIQKDGTVLWVLLSVNCVRRLDGRVEYFVAILKDITERKEVEEALQQSENRFRSLFSEMQEAFALGEALPVGSENPDDYQFIEMNPAFERQTGLRKEELLGRPATEALPGLERSWIERYCRVAMTGEATSFEDYNASTNRHYAVHSYSPRKGQFAIVFTDVTPMKQADAERASLQRRLALSSRMAAMGTLVAGVAHEVNNPLAAVLADRGLASEVVQEVRDRLRTSEPVDREAEAKRLDGVIEALDDAEEAGRRIAHIVKDLAKFARPTEEKARVRLIDAVQQAMRWLPATVGQAATVSVEDGGAPDVLGSFGQIEQVVVNLVTNAAKASKPGEVGVVIIRTSPGSQGMSRLDVLDRGVGIAPGLWDQIFDPFFTTRQVGEGKGMGLGLSICHTIVKAHGGTITVESEVGKGSTFRVELPVAPAEA